METFHCLPRELLERASSAEIAELLAFRKVQTEERIEREREAREQATTQS